LKSKILKKALEHIHNDVEIWKEAIILENPDEAKALLYSAVKSIPQCTEFWLALAKLEDYVKA
jgi:pre-mRNA-processing factor 6